MRFVSQKYKEAIQRHRTEGYRNSTYAEVYFGLIDYEAKPDSELFASNQESYSDANNMYREVRPITESYATLEQDFFRLDGSQKLLPDNDDYLPQGFVSSVLSDQNGYFKTPPYLEIVLGDMHSTVGLTILFDDISEQYAIDFIVTTWRNDIQVARHEVFDNSDIEFRDRKSVV